MCQEGQVQLTTDRSGAPECGCKCRIHLNEHVTVLAQLLVALDDGRLHELKERFIHYRGPDVDDKVTRQLLNFSPLGRHVLMHVREFLEEVKHMLNAQILVLRDMEVPDPVHVDNFTFIKDEFELTLLNPSNEILEEVDGDLFMRRQIGTCIDRQERLNLSL